MKNVARLWFLAVFLGVSFTAQAECTIADLDVKIVKSVWHNRCSKRDCAELKGSAVLTSRCDEPVAVEVRLTGIDADGAPLVTLERWPYAISHATAGEHEFSLNKWFKHDPAIRGFVIEVARFRPANQQ
jgi:hypothetical protein